MEERLRKALADVCSRLDDLAAAGLHDAAWELCRAAYRETRLVTDDADLARELARLEKHYAALLIRH